MSYYLLWELAEEMECSPIPDSGSECLRLGDSIYLLITVSLSLSFAFLASPFIVHDLFCKETGACAFPALPKILPEQVLCGTQEISFFS